MPEIMHQNMPAKNAKGVELVFRMDPCLLPGRAIRGLKCRMATALFYCPFLDEYKRYLGASQWAMP
jgi:hypothetical protein